MAPPVKFIQENGVDIYAKTTAEAVDGLKQMILDTIYPIGSIYISTESTNPGTVIGGTWQRFAEGRTILGASSSYPAGSTGGSSTVALNINQIPNHSHNHTLSASCVDAGNHSHSITTTYCGGSLTYGNYVVGYQEQANKGTAYTNDAGSHKHNVTISGSILPIGGDGAHENMMPYISTYIWKRTA